MKTRLFPKIICVLAALTLPGIALAYVGPGAGLTAIGTVLALIGAVLLGLFGFIWYPVKRLLRKRKSAENDEIEDLIEESEMATKSVKSKTDDR